MIGTGIICGWYEDLTYIVDVHCGKPLRNTDIACISLADSKVSPIRSVLRSSFKEGRTRGNIKKY